MSIFAPENLSGRIERPGVFWGTLLCSAFVDFTSEIGPVVVVTGRALFCKLLRVCASLHLHTESYASVSRLLSCLWKAAQLVIRRCTAIDGHPVFENYTC